MNNFFSHLKKSFTKPAYYPIQKGPDGNYIFIHINKTGGTSIDRALRIRKKHLTAREVIDWIGYEQYQKAFKFAVVRNPWSKVYSHYKFRLSDKEKSLQEKPLDFNEWVKKTYGPNKDPFYYDNPIMFQPQLDWLKNSEGEVEVDEILRFENLNDEFDRIKAKLGCKKSLPHVNQTSKSNYRDFYDEETKAIILEWFREDVTRFGYEF